MERATFCNTGSEAVMAAMRLARTVTGRDRIAYFTGDYHGMFEEVLVRGAWIDGVYKAQPVAPGIPQSLVDNILVLDYADPASLEILRSPCPRTRRGDGRTRAKPRARSAAARVHARSPRHHRNAPAPRSSSTKSSPDSAALRVARKPTSE